MSRKNKSQYHEPITSVGADAEEPIEDTIEVGAVVLIEDLITDTVEVGTVMLVDGPYDPVPLTTDTAASTSTDMAAAEDFSVLDGYSVSGGSDDFEPSTSTPSGFEAAADQASNALDHAKDTIGQVQDTVQDKGQDMAQNITQTAHDIAGRAQDTAQGLAGKAQDLSQSAAEKAKDAAQKIADSASTAKTAAVSAGSTSKSVVAGAASTVGTSLWSLIQRNPLQAILFIVSLVWLVRNNQATASQPTASVTDVAGDAADKVGTVAGQVQVAASNLSDQVQTQAQAGAGWFAQTLQTNPLAIGALGVVVGAGLGFAVPETNYEHKTLGKSRDALADKAQAAAQDLTQKVTTVATTAVHEAIESGKAEAKNQGLTPQDLADAVPAPQEQSQQQ